MTAHPLCRVTAGAIAAGILILSLVPNARGAVQASRFNVVLSAVPTSVDAKEFNEQVIDRVNDQVLTPRGLEGIEEIGFAWQFEAELRYFIRPNFAVSAGVGQLRTITNQEYLPALNAAVQYQAELLSVPVHVGGAYYLAPYTQGDFQARTYLGAGFTSQVYNRARFTSVESGTDSTTTLGGTCKYVGRGDSPGYYLEGGVHMFFASRYSLLVGLRYRSAVIRQMEMELDQQHSGPNCPPQGPVFDLDLGGIGGRFAVAIGF